MENKIRIWDRWTLTNGDVIVVTALYYDNVRYTINGRTRIDGKTNFLYRIRDAKKL